MKLYIAFLTPLIDFDGTYVALQLYKYYVFSLINSVSAPHYLRTKRNFLGISCIKYSPEKKCLD
jgi:hypothetical protein